MRARCSTPARTGPKRARHYARYLELATQAERRLFTHAEAEWLGRLETEIDNMRAALDWSLGCEPQLALRLAGALGPYWEVGYRGGEGLRWIQAALEAAGPAAPIADRARGVIELANVLALEDRLDDAIDAARRAVTLARESSDDALIADALVCLSEFAKQANDELEEIRPLAIEALARANSTGDERLIAWALMARANTLPPGDQAEREYHEAAAALRTAGDRWHLVSLLNWAAYNAIIEGSYTAAAALLDDALPLLRATGDPWHPLVTSGNLGLVRLLTGDDEGAQLAFEEQLRLSRDHNIRFGAGEGVGGLAAIAVQRRQFERAARLFGAATTLGPIAHPDLMAKLEHQFFDTARAQLGDRRWSEVVQAGRRVAFLDAIELALAAPRTLQARTAGLASHAE